MYTYNYDPKNQLNEATWGAPDFNTQTFSPTSNFKEYGLNYDPNGNITGLQRNNSAGTLTDNFNNYQYQSGTNKLTSVGSTATPTAYASYTYDNLGQLKSAQQAGVPFGMYLKYDVTGKITAICADAALTQVKIAYTYDEAGNRISKTDNTGSSAITTYYVYDAGGNVLAIYNNTTITEVPVYGSDRLGTYTISGNSYVYELRDNVGSVRVVVNRTKKSDGTADVVQYNDYYPYGSIARNGGSGYRYEYQGAYAEKDPITGWNNFDLRMYDGRIGRWLSVDPKHQYASPYEGMGNNPVSGFDPTGGESSPIFDKQTGDFLGNDSEGFTGDILFMTKNKYNALSANGSKTIDHKIAENNSYKIDELNPRIFFSEMTKAIDYIVKKDFPFSLKQLGNKGNIASFYYNGGAHSIFTGYKPDEAFANNGYLPLETIARTIGKAEDGDIKSLVVYNLINAHSFRTVENAQAIFWHEYIGHGLKNYDGGWDSHYGAYYWEMKYPKFKLTTEDFQADEILMMKSYKATFKGRL